MKNIRKLVQILQTNDMITKLSASKDNVLAIEVTHEYVHSDVEQCKKWFEEKLAMGIQQVNFLVKVDHLPLTHISCRAFWEDGLYALRHIRNMGHIAIVGHSTLDKVMVALDGAVFNRARRGLIERYFDVEDMDKAWAFVNEQV